MRISKSILIIATALLLSISSGFAQKTEKKPENTADNDTQTLEDESDASLRFEIIQSRLKLGPSDVVAAEITEDELGGYSVQITLSEKAAADLARITRTALGKSANIVVNNEVLSTSVIRSQLAATFLVTALTKEAAIALLEALTAEEE